MASGKLPVPAPMEAKGDVRANWKFFETQWDMYEIATGLEKKDDKIRVATLLSVMGKECFQIYQSLDISEEDRKKVKEILKSLRNHFEPKTSVIYERYKFNTTDQQPHEGTDTYVTRLRSLSNSCEFGTLQNELIRDRIVLGTKDSGTRSRMLRESDLSLDKAIDMCRASEIAELQMKKLDITEASVNYTAKQSSAEEKRERKSQTKRGKTFQKQDKSSCHYCGGIHARNNCPAYGETCAKCKKKNHFARVCFQTTKPPSKSRVHVMEETDSDDSVFTINSVDSKQWFVNLKMTLDSYKKTMKCQVDTGASCNIMSKRELQRLTKGNNPVFIPTRTKLKQYDGAILTPLGMCQIMCTVGERTETLEFLIVSMGKRDTATLLSAAASVKLGIITVNMVNKVIEVPDKPLTKENVLQDYKDVFEGLGCLPGSYTIEIDTTVKPVQHQPRKIPVAQKAEVKAEIERLERKGIITKVVQPTDWISSMVVVRKPNKLRICLDPKDLNKAVKRSKYMMPTIDDILPKVTKAKVFTVLDAKYGFWQVKLTEASSHLTTFWTPMGRYRWLRLPFGISSAPEEFQRRQHEALDGLEGADVIADDIIVYGCGETMDEAVKDHDKKLLQVLERARTISLSSDKLKSVTWAMFLQQKEFDQTQRKSRLS